MPLKELDTSLKNLKNDLKEKVFVTHGFQAVFSKYLNENGIAADEVKTQYGNDEEDKTEQDKTEGDKIAEDKIELL